jgi:hypothetical protein
MTAISAERQARSSARRRGPLSVLAGCVLAPCAAGLVALGVIALSQASSNGGYVSLGAASYHTSSYAVTSDSDDWSGAKYLFGSLGQVRVRITPDGGSTRAFAGLARPGVLQRYLAGVGYATGHQSSGHGVSFTQHSGNAPAVRPAGAGIWPASATGAGPLTLQFGAHAQHGDLVLVAMNADGSPSVGGHVATAATVPALPWIVAGLLAAGAVLLAGSAALIVKPARRSGRGAPAAT